MVKRVNYLKLDPNKTQTVLVGKTEVLKDIVLLTVDGVQLTLTDIAA